MKVLWIVEDNNKEDIIIKDERLKFSPPLNAAIKTFKDIKRKNSPFLCWFGAIDEKLPLD